MKGKPLETESKLIVRTKKTIRRSIGSKRSEADW